MFRKCKRLITRLTITLGFTALLTGLLGFSPAHADITAHFEAVAFAGAKAEAEAKAAAVGEIDVTARTLLEEERASMPASLVKKWKSPTKEQTRKYGTLVHSMEAAQRVLNKQITAYLNVINDARLDVAKAKLKLKYADTRAEKRKWQKRLNKAKKRLRAIYLDEHWKFRPLIGMDNGCFLNTGRNGNMVLNSFGECIGEGTKRAQVWFGFDLNEDAIRVVLVVFHDGSTKEGCLNFALFDIPEGTPSEDMVLVVESLLKVKVTVRVAVTVTGRLTVRGELRRDGVVCDSEEKSKEVSVTKYVTKTVSAKSVEEALAFGEEEVNVDVELQESVMAEVEREVTAEISLTMDLSCEEAAAPQAVVNEINDVVEYNERSVGFALSGSPGEVLQVVGYAKHGGSITAGKTQSITLDSNGNATGNLTYVAGEVPKAALEYYIEETKYTIAAGKDVVWIQVRDAHGNTVWAKSNDFDITPRPVTP